MEGRAAYIRYINLLSRVFQQKVRLNSEVCERSLEQLNKRRITGRFASICGFRLRDAIFYVKAVCKEN